MPYSRRYSVDDTVTLDGTDSHWARTNKYKFYFSREGKSYISVVSFSIPEKTYRSVEYTVFLCIHVEKFEIFRLRIRFFGITKYLSSRKLCD